MKQLFYLFLIVILAINIFPNVLLAQDFTPDFLKAVKMKNEKSVTKQQLYSGSAHAEIDWENEYLVVTAYGAADKSQVVNIADEKVQASDAAYLNAIEKAAEIIVGIRITGLSTIQQFYKMNTMIKQTINGYIRGIDHLEEYDRFEEMPDGSWLAQVSIGLPLYGNNGFIPKVLNIKIIAQEIEKNKLKPFKPSKKIRTASKYSGLIIDCRKMGEQPVISVLPRIITPDKKSVYGMENVPRSVLLNGGLVGYASSIKSSAVAKRVGDNPLTITPADIDKRRKDHIIVTQDDANKILGADEQQSFRSKAKVLILF